MCEPTTWIMIGSAVLGAAGSIQQGQSISEAADANAKFGRIMARDALDRGEADAADARRQGDAFKGSQAAAFGASGAEINTGSSATILEDTAQLNELDIMRLRNNAEREAFAFESGAAIDTATADNARTAGGIGAAGSLIGGAGQVAGRWQIYRADNPGNSFGNFLGFGNSAPPPTTTLRRPTGPPGKG